MRRCLARPGWASLSRYAQGEAKDLLFISTERYKFCVLEWDSSTGALPRQSL